MRRGAVRIAEYGTSKGAFGLLCRSEVQADVHTELQRIALLAEFQIACSGSRCEKEGVVVCGRQVLAPDIEAHRSEIQTGVSVQQSIERLAERIVFAPVYFSGSRNIHSDKERFDTAVFQRLLDRKSVV